MKKPSIGQFAILFALGIVSTLFLKNTIKMLSSGKRLDELRVEVDLLEEEKRSLEEEIAYKQTDEFVEEQARNNLNLIKPDEEVFILPDIEDSTGDFMPIAGDPKDEDRDVLGIESQKGIKGTNIYLWYRLFFH